MSSDIKISQLPVTNGRDPAELLPNSGGNPFQTSAQVLADVVGNYNGFTSGTRPLTAAQTAGLTTNNLVNTVVTGTDAYPFALQAGAGSTSLPLSVIPADYSSGNEKVYNLLTWHAVAFAVEGLAGAGYLGLGSQSATPGAPTTGLRVYADSLNRLGLLNSAGFAGVLDTTSLTGSQVYSLPNATGNVVLDSATQTLTNKTIGVSQLSGTLLVSQGGTGVTTFGGTNTLLYTTSAGTLASLATANNSVLVTSGGGIPSLSTTLPSAVQVAVGSLAAGTNASSTTFWNGSGTWSAAVTSVNLSVPTGLTVSGGPVTGSGTLALGISVSGMVKGSGGTFVAATAATDYVAPSDITISGLTQLGGTMLGRSSGGSGAIQEINVGTGLTLSGGTLSSSAAGSVSSVGLSMPTGFTVTNSPVTTTGTLTVATSLSGVLVGTGSAFSTATIGTALSYSGGTLSNTGVTALAAGNGVSVSSSTGSVTVANTGVLSITGTGNEVIASGSTGNITLSLPQGIATSSAVQFQQLGVGVAAPTYGVNINYTSTDTSGNVYGLQLQPLFNQTSGNAANIDFLISRTETNVGSGAQYFEQFKVGGTSKWYVDHAGNLNAAGALTGGSVVSNSTIYASGLATLSGGLDATGTITLGSSTGLVKLTGGIVGTATAGTDYAPATTGSSILYGNGSGGFSSVTVGATLSFSTGTLSAVTATTSNLGVVKPDGSTITVSGGVISAVTTGTVTSFSSGNLSPLFTTSVATATSTPALTFALSSTSQNYVLAGPTSGSGAPTYRALVAGDIPSLSYVTSVGLSMPGIFSVSNSPVTTSGTLTVALATQTANYVWAGPTTGAAAAPTFRALVAADIPAISLTAGVSGTLPVANGGTGVTSSTGTGSVVLSASPTFTGTLTAAALTATGTTTLATSLTGVAYLTSGVVSAYTTNGTGTTVALTAGTTFTGTTAIATLNLTNALGTAYGGTGATTVAAANQNLIPPAVNLGNLTGTVNINWASGSVFYGTLTGNTTFTFSNAVSAQNIVVRVYQTGTNTYTVTWPTVSWASGTAPSMTTGAAVHDTTTLVYANGTYDGNSLQNISP